METNALNRFSVELNRSFGDRIFILLILGNIVTVLALPGVHNETGPNLDCTNDLDTEMSCQFEAQNCSGYDVTLVWNEKKAPVQCIPEQCSRGCCCSVKTIIVLGESHNVTVWKDGRIRESKIISIKESIKPKTPTIMSVHEVNGNFHVRWKTNIDDITSDMFTPYVIYHKKGDTEKVNMSVSKSTIGGFNTCVILGQKLEPSTKYLVSVQTYTDRSGKFSDSSKELEFTTPASSNVLLIALIIILSIAAVLISSAIFVCSVKLKTRWWDLISKGPNPKLLIMHSYDQEWLKPEPTIISPACVETLVPDDGKPWSKGSLTDNSSGSFQQSSGISTGSSCLSYANTEPADIIAGVHDALGKAFPNISPISPLTTNLLTESNKDSGLFSAPNNPCSVRADDVNSGSSGFDNKTYSILVPNCPRQIMMDSSEVQTQDAMLCDSAYHPSEGDMVICPDQQVPACPLLNLPPVVSSPMPSDMSYQPCNADSGRLSLADDSSLSSISSGTNTTASCDPVSRVEAGCDSFEEATICDDNPCYGCMPAGSPNFPQVNDDYQAFQSLVGQPDVLFSEQRSVEREEDLDKYPAESYTKIPPVTPDFINNVQSDQGLSELQRPFLSLHSAEPMTVITDSSYQSV
ncbi:uncharacterized protein LOC111219228 isoform X1 [Seriola dumerili]|uniref:Uncharacterized LOC111219228 n=2 Tax=Seriola dumerili TaxID=41447 RepID=A0A3B4TBN2_SERDU|nr:uncharacterized protein LOC111219228 isoform X1 [Seriola dumerili]